MESVLTVLPIGQGACNLVEVYDNSNELVFLGMVDCGNKTNEQAFNVAGYSGELNSNVNASYQYLREKMKARAQVFYGADANNDQIYLDLFILTHQDGDHHNRFVDLVKDLIIQNAVTETNFTLKCLGNVMVQYTYTDTSSCSYSYSYALPYDSKKNYNIKHYYQSLGDETFVCKIGHKELRIIKYINNTFSISFYDTNSRKSLESISISANNNTIINNRGKIIYYIAEGDKKLLNKPGWKYYIIYKAFCEIKSVYFDNKLNKCFFQLFNTSDQIKENFISEKKISNIIGEFWKGGASYKQQANNFVKRISARTKTYVDRAKSDYNYEIKNGNTTVGTVKVLCNLEIEELNQISIKDSHETGPNYKNGSSLVTLWTIGDTKYLFPGDATVHTMMYLNTEYNKLPKDEHGTCTECVKRESAIMTAPHHGSDHSSKGKKQPASSETKYQGDWGIYREFLDNYKPSAVTISAGRNYGFGHPGPEFVKATDCYFNNTGTDEHIIYTCIHEDSKNKYYGLYQTSSPIYSTLQYDEGDRKVYFQRLQFTNSIIPNYEIVNESKIACQCNPNLSNYLTLDVGSCTGCSPKFIDESSSSSDWFCKYRCESTMAKDENTEDDKSDPSTETGGRFTDECNEEDDEVIMEEEEDLGLPRPVKRRRTE